jgi:hypothetical protein
MWPYLQTNHLCITSMNTVFPHEVIFNFSLFKTKTNPGLRRSCAKRLPQEFHLTTRIGFEKRPRVPIKMAASQDVDLLWLQSTIIDLQCQICWRQVIMLAHCHQERSWRDVGDMSCWFILAERFDTDNHNQ